MSDAVSVSLLVLRCGDISLSRAFYAALGFSFSQEQHGSGPVHFSSTAGGVVIELYPKGAHDTSDIRFGLHLRKVSVLETVTKLGGRVLSRGAGGAPSAVVLDPDGHTIELEFERWPKPTSAEIDAFRAAAPGSVPDAYPQYVAERGAVQLDVPSISSGLVWFWPLDEVLKLNEGYGTSRFAEGLFAFGSDGAGELYVFDLRDPEHVTVGQVPSFPLEIERYQVLAESFEAFARVLSTGTPAE